MNLRIGIDIGSTTVKVVVLDETNKLLFRSYERHFSKVREKTCEILARIQDQLTGRAVKMVITGSAGLGVSKVSGVDFVQEVYATAAAVDTFIPGTDAVIELGGEDAKIIFFGGALEERMNGSCAGGTGAFIDQMATLMNVTGDELDKLALKHEKIYPIASQKRHPAHPESGWSERRRCRLDFSGRCGSDHRRPHPGTGSKGDDCLSGRPPPLSDGAAGALCGHPPVGCGTRHLPSGRRLLCRHWRSSLRLGL